MAVLKAHTFDLKCRKLDPRGPGYWGNMSSMPFSEKVFQWRYVTFYGFVFLMNMLSVILFVVNQYGTAILYVNDPFHVAVEGNQAEINTVATTDILYALTFVPRPAHPLLTGSQIYIIDFLIRGVAATDRIAYLFNFGRRPGLLKYVPVPTMDFWDLASIIAIQVVYFMTANNDPNARYDLQVFSTVRIFGVTEALTLIQALVHQKSSTMDISPIPRIRKALLETATTAVAIIFCGAALFMHIENWSDDREPKLDFLQCVYFVVTTMTTVGYGDISPTSNLARGFTILLMLYLIITLFPRITNAAELIAQITPYNSKPGTYSSQPVILYKYGSPPSVDMVDKFASELFHPDQIQQVSLVVVSRSPPDQELDIYLTTPRSDNITYIEGSLMDNMTCRRAGVEYAKACILMHNDDCPVEEMLLQDESLCVIGLRIRQYTDDTAIKRGWTATPARIILCLNHTYNAIYFKHSFYGSVPPGDLERQTEFLSIRELQLQTLAKGVLCPGFHPFVANLAAHVEGMSMAELRQQFGEDSREWQLEYFQGASHETYSAGKSARSFVSKLNRSQMGTEMNVDEFRTSTIDLDETSGFVPEWIKLVKQGGLPWTYVAAIVYEQTGAVMVHYGNRYKLLSPSREEASSCIDVLNSLTAETFENHPQLSQKGVGKTAPLFAGVGCKLCAIPLKEDACEDVNLAYQQLGLEASFGPIKEFSTRHMVQDPRIRMDPSCNQQLVQDPYSKLCKTLKNHTILIGGNVEHAPYFIRVLRTVDVSLEDQGDIVILSNHIGSPKTHKILCLFRGVYVVSVPEEDAGFVSMKTLMGINLPLAKNVILTANAAGTDEQTYNLDHHHMSLRVLIRNVNPNARVIFEVEDYEMARNFIRGDEECNAWCDDQAIRQNSYAVMSKKWSRRSSKLNRAACISSGLIVEEDMFASIVTSCVHRSSDVHLLQAMLGGSKFDFAMSCVQLPPAFAGRTYGELLLQLCLEMKLPVALYRAAEDDLQEYIYTNPLSSTILRANDLVYVSSKPETETACCARPGVPTNSTAVSHPSQEELNELYSVTSEDALLTHREALKQQLGRSSSWGEAAEDPSNEPQL